MTTRTRTTTRNNVVEEYLKAPYARIVMPEGNGSFVAEILEFPGCLAQGDTAQEALANLERAAKGWIEAALEQGQEIPPPTTNQGFSGRLALRLPRSLHRQATLLAQRDGTSLNQFLVTAVAARVGAEDIFGKIAQRYAKAWSVVHQDFSFNWTQVNVAAQNIIAPAVLHSTSQIVLPPHSAPLLTVVGGTYRA